VSLSSSNPCTHRNAPRHLRTHLDTEASSPSSPLKNLSSQELFAPLERFCSNGSNRPLNLVSHSLTPCALPPGLSPVASLQFCASASQPGRVARTTRPATHGEVPLYPCSLLRGDLGRTAQLDGLFSTDDLPSTQTDSSEVTPSMHLRFICPVPFVDFTHNLSTIRQHS